MTVLPCLIFINEEINFTHIIDEFSFGEYFPAIMNPLDYTSQRTTEGNSLDELANGCYVSISILLVCCSNNLHSR